jgi:hypothetical protein
MKFFLTTLLSLGLSTNLFAFDSFQGVNFHINPSEKDQVHLKINNEFTHVFENDFVLITQGIYKPFLNKKQQYEGTFGFRKFNGNVGFGLNFNYAINNSLGFFAHRLCPGLEMFVGDFHISINHYFPKKELIDFSGVTYQFNSVYEFAINYKPEEKYEFAVIPFINSSSMEWGVNTRFSAFIFDNIELEVCPFFTSINNGVSFSVGFHLGGPKSSKIQSIRKSNTFMSIDRIEKQKDNSWYRIPLIGAPLVNWFGKSKEIKKKIYEEKGKIAAGAAAAISASSLYKYMRGSLPTPTPVIPEDLSSAVIR